jgi:hypothetical protein
VNALKIYSVANSKQLLHLAPYIGRVQIAIKYRHVARASVTDLAARHLNHMELSNVEWIKPLLRPIPYSTAEALVESLLAIDGNTTNHRILETAVKSTNDLRAAGYDTDHLIELDLALNIDTWDDRS